jgi:hypothetical protein
MSDYTGFSIDEIVQDLEYEDRYQRECNRNQHMEECRMYSAEKNQMERRYLEEFGRKVTATLHRTGWLIVEYVPYYDPQTGLEL